MSVAPFVRIIYKVLVAYAVGSALMIVALNIMISFFFNELDSTAKKNSLYYKIRSLKGGVISLAGSSLFAWISSSVFIPFTKYNSTLHDINLYLPSVIICSFGCLLYLYCSYALKSISDNCKLEVLLALKKSQNGNEEKTDAMPTGIDKPSNGVELGNVSARINADKKGTSF